MKAIGYIRVSTSEQAREGISLENQREQIERYATYRGVELVEVLEDAGISGGKNAARDGFVRLLDTIERREIGALVIYSLERLSRDMLTLLSFERLLDEYGIELHTVEGQVSTSTPDGWLSFAMKAFLGEVERRQVKHRTKSAMAHMKEKGAVVGSVPYGFVRDGDNLVENPGEQAVVRRINALYGQGHTLTGICRTLAQEGVYSRSGKLFSVMQVKRIIAGYREVFKRARSEMGETIREFILKAA